MEEGAMAEEAYNRQREEAIINYTRDSRIQTKQNQKDKLTKRKEYLKKPRKLNRHGVLYEEVMK